MTDTTTRRILEGPIAADSRADLRSIAEIQSAIGDAAQVTFACSVLELLDGYDELLASNQRLGVARITDDGDKLTLEEKVVELSAWKAAVEDACDPFMVDVTTPRETLGRLTVSAQMMAVDPLISEAAHKLVEGKNEALAACAEMSKVLCQGHVRKAVADALGDDVAQKLLDKKMGEGWVPPEDIKQMEDQWNRVQGLVGPLLRENMEMRKVFEDIPKRPGEIGSLHAQVEMRRKFVHRAHNAETLAKKIFADLEYLCHAITPDPSQTEISRRQAMCQTYREALAAPRYVSPLEENLEEWKNLAQDVRKERDSVRQEMNGVKIKHSDAICAIVDMRSALLDMPPERKDQILAHASRHETEGLKDNDISRLLGMMNKALAASQGYASQADRIFYT